MENKNLGEKEFVAEDLRVPVYYEDTDFSGYVFHANYLKYFDRAREEIFGTTLLRDLFSQGLHFVVKSASLDFLLPVRHGDTLVVRTKVKFSHSPLVFFRHEARICQAPEGKNTAVTAGVELVSVNGKGFPVRLPPLLQDLFHSKYRMLS